MIVLSLCFCIVFSVYCALTADVKHIGWP